MQLMVKRLARIEAVDATHFRLVFSKAYALVAPSHATPLGGALPIGRRLALLDWAAQADAWVLEDDCDSYQFPQPSTDVPSPSIRLS